MRTIPILLYVAIVSLLGTGCNKWLDTQPSDQISDEKLYQNADGFRTALNGVYQQVSVRELYGHHLTWGLASVMSQDYDRNNLDYVNYYLADYNYTQATYTVPVINGIWSKSYNAIANCNKIISAIEPLDSTFFPLLSAERNLILGEAMAMRGLLHFELLRLYAPAPAAQPQGYFIPYVSEYPARYTAPSTTIGVMDSIIRDLETAQVLVARNDTITNRTMMMYKLQSLMAGGNTPNGGLFFNYRMHRLNYVAIQGLLARAYLYKGDYVKALEKADYLYKQFSPAPSSRLKWWAWTASYSMTGADKYIKLVDDVIMAFYNPEEVNMIKAIKDQYSPFNLADEFMTTWLPGNVRDYRMDFLGLSAENKKSPKWNETTSQSQWRKEQNFLMPVLRFSEIYLIYAETLFHAGRTTEALAVFNEFRYARGRTTAFNSTDPEAFYEELLLEYRREFFEEGQTVFAHKRLNRPIMVGTRRIDIDQRLVLPIPEGETIF